MAINTGIVRGLIISQPTGTVAIGRYQTRYPAHRVVNARGKVTIYYFGAGGKPVAAEAKVAATYRHGE
jgi:hypothetical protein